MAKTLKQMADELGVPKQRLYRFVKQTGITEVHQENKTMYYDEAAEKAIKEAFLNEVHHDVLHDVHQKTLYDVHHEAGEAHQMYIINSDDVHHETVDVLHDAVSEALKHNEKIIEALQNSLDMMQRELEKRDRQIEQLQTALEEERLHNHEISEKLAQLADQAQQLQLIQMQPPVLPVSEEADHQKKSFWKRIFKRGD